jgi:uncharacterized protein
VTLRGSERLRTIRAKRVAGRPRRHSERLATGQFFLLAFTVSWAFWLPVAWWSPSGVGRQALLVAGTFGPGVAAVALMIGLHGRAGFRREVARQWKWRIGARTWLLVAFAPVLAVLGAIGLARAAGAPEAQWNDPSQWYLVFGVLAYVAVFGGPLGEELGWRGFALPRLQERMNPTAAVALLGLAWGLWHLPLFWIDGTVQQQIPIAAFLAQTTVTSVIYGWLWNTTGSLPAVIALHAVANTTVGLFPVLPDEAQSVLPLWFAIALAGLFAVVLIVQTRGRLAYGRSAPPVRQVEPTPPAS